jgi:hypothetical protein
MIIDVKSGTATASDTGIGLDLSGMLDFSFTSGFDLGSLFGSSASTSSISNQRGAELYKTATSRCKSAVLNSCQQQGVDISVITNGYDLEIDKQCLLYERSLDDANVNMSATVRNAKSVLQKARLLVAQQKNSYDLRGCINALDSCMQDDFVCGSDYENCLDPTGKYIVNGAVVVGSTPGKSGDVTTPGALYTTWNYSGSLNAWTGTGTIQAYIEAHITSGVAAPPVTGKGMVGYLQSKIGYVDGNGKSMGMCISVLNKCQNYTYTAGSSNAYKGDNDVIKNYMTRTLVQVKAMQDEVLAKYAEGCISDVASCLSTNNITTSFTAAKKACGPRIDTCKSVTGTTSDDDILASSVPCPAKSKYSSSLTATKPGAAGVKAVLESTAVVGAYCECVNAGVLTSTGTCP